MELLENHGLPAQQTGGIYRQFLFELRQLSGAAAASLYIEDREGAGAAPLLVHCSHTEALPEFESVETADDAVNHYSNLSGQSPPPALQVFATEGGGCLLVVQVGTEFGAGDDPWPGDLDRRSGLELPDLASAGTLWVGLRFEDGVIPPAILALKDPGAGPPGSADGWLAHCLLSNANLLWEADRIKLLLRDPTSRLPGRAEFQYRLSAVMHELHGRATFGLLLINPDEFDMVNRRLDRDSGDAALAQVAATLCDCLRRTDGVFRYGGAVFAVHMPGATRASLVAFAEKIRGALTGAYLSGAMRLSFSIGCALYDPSRAEDRDLDDVGLLRRAGQALNTAKDRGGDRSVLWQEGDADEDLVDRTQLAGIFTANVEKDYRNMTMLWDIITMVAEGDDNERLARTFVERIQLALRPAWAALFSRQEGDRPRLLAQSGRASFPEGEQPAEVDALLAAAQEAGAPQSGSRQPGPYDRDATAPRKGYALPLKIQDRTLACLYLEGPEAEMQLDSSDLLFLRALNSQLAMALDRADHATRRQVEREQESRRLRTEVQGLRQAVQSARLVYHSRPMEALLTTARAAAPTDVTVLIRGESGTGKEMLARAVHDMSSRAGKPFVTVDCGSIAANLIEAELFGALKGSFTGADRASTGRIVQADGGTLFLDEIGEVPLDVQAKLLRFVQEKEIHPVGAATSQRVDARIVAATNRDLAREVSAGRFREDLYFRLNVVTLVAPALRERPDDILPLAAHFLERFALQYNKGPLRFTAAAEQRLQEHSWPGNVRELQNCVLRAVVLSSSDSIDASGLAIGEPGGEQALTHIASAQLDTAPAETGQAHRLGEPWQELGEQLDHQVDAALSGGPEAALPLGRWLSEDLVLCVDSKANGTARRGARRLGIAETTYRRQLQKARQQQARGLAGRSESWQQLQVYIDHLADCLEEDSSTNIMEAVRSRLLQAVTARVGQDDATGSALMGITIPTYRRWLAQQ